MPAGEGQQRRYTRPIELGVLEVAKRKAASQLNVFIAGPYVERGWSQERLAEASSSARLRLALIDRVLGREHSAILGEHRGVAEVTGDNIPSTANVVLSELQLVESADAIVIIPDSPGSFCELGSWVMRDDFPPKTLILGNGEYQNIFGYVGNGVFSMAEDMNARVEWVDYNDIEAVDLIVGDFLSRIQDKLVSRRLRRGQ